MLSARAPRPAALVGVALFVLFCALAANLAQKDYEFLLEVDFQVTETRQWSEFYRTGDVRVFSNPRPYSYYDGQPIVTGAVSLLLEFAAGVFPGLRATLVKPLSFDMAATNLVNVISYAGAAVLFYATVLAMTGAAVWSALVAVAYFLAPQMLHINIIRTDFQMSLPLLATLYVSVLITQKRERRPHAIWLGVSMAFLATIKMSGIAFGILPALAYLVAGRPSGAMQWRRTLSFIGTSVGTFALTFCALMIRYFYFFSLEDWLWLYPRAWKVFSDWNTIYLYTPRTYYNVEILSRHGPEFIVLYLAASAVLMYFAIARRWRSALFIVLSLLVFTAIGVAMMKYERGGYHMLPFMYATVGLAVWSTWQSRWHVAARSILVGVACVALASSTVRAAGFYRERVQAAEMTARAVDEMWRPFRSWISTNLPYGSVCIEKYSEWGFPQINDVTEASFTYGPFDFPFVHLEEMAKYEPPSLSQVRASCDVLVLNDYHKKGFADRFQEASPALAERWKALYAEIERIAPPVVFSSSGRAGAGTRIEVYDLRSIESDVCRHVSTPLVVSQQQENMFLVHLPALKGQSDDMRDGDRSTLLLCEGSRRLGPAHALHANIRKVGHGSYSHWGEWMLFSTSDNTDPRTNGRTYHVVQQRP